MPETGSRPALNSSPSNRRRKSTSGPSILITRQQAAEILGMPAGSLYDLIVRGVVPTVRFPGSRRIWLKRTDVLALIEASTVIGEA